MKGPTLVNMPELMNVTGMYKSLSEQFVVGRLYFVHSL